MTATLDALASDVTTGKRIRINPFVVVLVIAAIVLVVVTLTTRSTTDTAALSTNSTEDTGAMALAEVLRSQGVQVDQIDAMAQSRIVDPDNTTLVVVDVETLLEFQVESVLEYPGDVVWISPSGYGYDEVGDDLWYVPGTGTVAAAVDCDHPAALLAEEIDAGPFYVNVPASSSATGCFEASAGNFAYAVVEEGGRTIIMIESYSAFTNEFLDQRGNAALAINLTGANSRVVWYLGTVFDSTTLTWGDGDGQIPEFEATPDFTPPGTAAVLLVLGLAALTLALSLGRRFGRLVPEPLPVIVRGSEATRGRARMYRAGRSRGRAAAALRAASALRIAHSLAVPRSAGPDGLVAAAARASRQPSLAIRDLIYGPPPTDDAALVALATALDDLETEIHR